jgi:glucan phosphoethanolaminetransferase (alkaline phosphatase superfamily)
MVIIMKFVIWLVSLIAVFALVIFLFWFDFLDDGVAELFGGLILVVWVMIIAPFAYWLGKVKEKKQTDDFLKTKIPENIGFISYVDNKSGKIYLRDASYDIYAGKETIK